MSIKLGEIAPNFTAESTQGEINFYEWLGSSWGILFSHPADFTPICTTELSTLATLKHEFDARKTKIITVSVDPIQDHQKWIDEIYKTQNIVVNYPLVADPDRIVASLYGMIHPNADCKQTVRSVFMIAPDRTVKLTLTYPVTTGRNFHEILRILDSIRLTAYNWVATPANWTQGEDCIIVPSIPDEEIPKKFPKGYRKVTDYLRYTPQPDID